MRIGIPEGLLFCRYEHEIRGFSELLQLDTVYSGHTNREILEEGIRICVDEACLPIKIFHGHVAKLEKECDKIVVPRLMKCEYGESICPKFAGLPELVESATGSKNLIFTSPLFLNNPSKFRKSLVRDGRAIGLRPREIKEALQQIRKTRKPSQQPASFVRSHEGNFLAIAVLGHPYNTGDSFANRNLIHKLQSFGAQVIMGEDLVVTELERFFKGLMKQPYWLFFRENYAKAMWLAEQKAVDGIVYVSSFNCGTDSVTIEMIQKGIGELPLLVLKLDEHTGEAGIDTRIEAFIDLLKRRKSREGNLSDHRRYSSLWTPTVCGTWSKAHQPFAK